MMTMMVLLLLCLLAPPLWQAPNQTDADPPVEVVRFSWSRNRESGPDDRGPASANQARREFEHLREMSNRGSVEERSRAMRELEERTAKESRPGQALDLYRYRIELKNRGSSVIKWIFIDYQTSAASDPENPSHRQFACSVTIKPNQNKLIEVFSNLPPNRVVSAANANKPLIERVIINRIEFADGQAWQRPTWQAPEKVSSGPNRGQCLPI
jgi:hypothetical protein